jgi:Ser/Thr protein kinase RdoA (MazF antagonist)
MQRHGPVEEARVLTTWLDRLRPLAPALHAELAAAALGVVVALHALPEGPTATVHRDLHDQQAFVTPDGDVAFIDLDTLGEGDPAVDLANLAAHLELLGAPELGETLLRGYGAPAAWAPRLAVLRRATLLRLACVHAFRPGSGRLVARLLAATREDVHAPAREGHVAPVPCAAP